MSKKNNKQTQITFAPNIENIEELGAKWYNIVSDITEALESHGFQYSRTLGFVNDRELSKEELQELGAEIVSLAMGPENLLYLDSYIIDNVTDLTYLFKKK